MQEYFSEVAVHIETYLRDLQMLPLSQERISLCATGANIAEMSLTLLLSLRFLAVVFEEIRNLALGLAARNLQWKAMGRGAGIQVGYISTSAAMHVSDPFFSLHTRGSAPK